MKRLLLLASLVVAPGCYVESNFHASAPDPAPVSSPEALPASPAPAAVACAVWDREVAFARSVHDHDASAFAEHLHPGAIFLDAEGAAQGREAIVKAWEPLVRGDTVHLGWHPTSVLVTGDPHVALSRGPFWLEIAKPGEPPKYMTGAFQSIWSQDADGAWRVLVDGPTPPPRETTREEVERLKATLPAKCPMAG